MVTNETDMHEAHNNRILFLKNLLQHFQRETTNCANGCTAEKTDNSYLFSSQSFFFSTLKISPSMCRSPARITNGLQWRYLLNFILNFCQKSCCRFLFLTSFLSLSLSPTQAQSHSLSHTHTKDHSLNFYNFSNKCQSLTLICLYWALQLSARSFHPTKKSQQNF